MENRSIDPENSHKDALYTLAQRYPIRYHWLSRIPIQLHITGNRLHIRFFVRYAKNMMENFPGTDITYADIAEAGIRSNWSGKYPLPWLADDGYERAMAKACFRVLEHGEDPSEDDISPAKPSVRVTLEFIRYGTRKENRRFPLQKYYRVHLSQSKIFASHAISPPWRWYWGFFRYLHLESVYLNWSRMHPGNVTVQKIRSRHTFQQTCAHEIGHLLGLGDAYSANYRFYYEAPRTGSYMMSHNRRVQPAEIEMVVRSHMTNRMQYFPIEFRLKTIFSGIKRTIQLAYHPLSLEDKKRKRKSDKK